MLLIKCPVCGVEGDDADFAYGGEAHIKRPASFDPENISLEAQRDYLFVRKNPRGVHHEMWRCMSGCGKWFHVARDTMSQKIYATYKFSDPIPNLGLDDQSSSANSGKGASK